MKKIVVLLIMSLVCASFAACGKGQTTKEDAQVEKVAPTQEAETGEEEPAEEAPSFEETYATILDRYKEAIAAKQNGTDLANGGLSPACERYYGDGDPLETIGYAYLDINKDDVPELFIGPMNDDRLIEVYTITEGSVIVVASSSSNVDYWFYSNTMIGSKGVVSDKTTGYNYYLLDGAKLQFAEGVLYDSLFTAEPTWYKADSDDYSAMNDTMITEAEAQKVIDYYNGMKAKPEYKSFATYGQ